MTLLEVIHIKRVFAVLDLIEASFGDYNFMRYVHKWVSF